MGLYQQVRELWKKPKENLGALWTERLIAWRKENSTVKLEHPTRIDRARSLGYKAKQGFVVVRQKVIRGGHTKNMFQGGRRSKRFGMRMDLRKNLQQVAEERAQKQFDNLMVLNSYWVASDGQHSWYEVIFIDPNHPVIKSDKNLAWVQSRKAHSRVFHGQTSAGRKGRGLRWKGKGAEHLR